MQKLEKYVGRIVRLKQRALERITGGKRIFVDHEDNCFLVAAIDRQMSRLICYGANRRIDVCAADIVLI